MNAGRREDETAGWEFLLISTQTESHNLGQEKNRKGDAEGGGDEVLRVPRPGKKSYLDEYQDEVFPEVHLSVGEVLGQVVDM